MNRSSRSGSGNQELRYPWAVALDAAVGDNTEQLGRTGEIEVGSRAQRSAPGSGEGDVSVGGMLGRCYARVWLTRDKPDCSLCCQSGWG